VTERPATVPRRAVLVGGAAGAAAAAAALTGCTGHSAPSPPPSSSTSTGVPTSAGPSPAPPTAADWRALAAGLDGSLLLPGSAGFPSAHRLYDPRWDALVPAAVLRAAGPDDLSEAVRFAAAHGLRVAPRGGGHSYLGASSPAGGLVVDTRSMHSVAYDAGSGLATIGAGAQLIDVYRALGAHGRAVPAGTCPSVGLAGLAQGGGFGIFDRTHGLTCDGIVSLDIVTAEGERRTVDSRREPDLFWALRGGGGGDFAIVTSVRTRTFGTGPVGRWSARWPWSRAAAVVAGWQRFMAGAADQVWANVHLDVLADGSRQVLVIGFAHGGRSPAADLAALVRRVGTDPLNSSSAVHSHLATVESLAGRFTRESFVAGSSVPAAWLSGAGIGRLVAAVADASRWTGERHAICDPLGGAVARVAADATAFPWRRSPFTVQWYAKLPLSHPTADQRAAQEWVATSRSGLNPDMPGAYINYPSADVRGPATYHGATLTRLTQVKAAYDPRWLFRPPAGVPG
jgi:FAD/FMN-containing dehydrogenase